MKNYKITVNGKAYDVEVEEISGYPQTMSTTSAPVSASKEVQSTPTAQSSEASLDSITAPLQGMILTIAVKKGDSVKRGDLLLKIEAMKMENEVVAPRDCVIESVNVNDGDRVSSGDVLFSIR